MCGFRSPYWLFILTGPRTKSDIRCVGYWNMGPTRQDSFPDPIRVATLAPHGESRPIFDFMKNLNSDFDPRERRDYLPSWPSFQSVFRLRMCAAGNGCHEEVNHQLDTDLQKSPQPHVTIAEHLVRAIQRLEARRSDFDVLFVYIPKRLGVWFCRWT